MTSVRVSTWVQADGTTHVLEKHTQDTVVCALMNIYPAGTDLDAMLASNGAMTAELLAEKEANTLLGGE